jgi:hypothetical protein
LKFFDEATIISVNAIISKTTYMNKRFSVCLQVIGCTFLITNFIACSKSDPAPTPVPVTDLCAGKTIDITATPKATDPCSADGAIDVSATGSTNFTFKLNSGGTYQASGKFTNVAAGNYTVFAKDAAGCEKSVAVTVTSASGTAGPQFTAMKNLVAARCQTCHNNSLANGGMNFQVECNIISNKVRIKVRAVDEASMPQTGPLPQAEKDIITAWINGGGGYSN